MATLQQVGVGTGAVHVATSQLELVLAAAATTKSVDPLLCFDLLNKLLVAIENDPRELLCMAQRKCEDVLQGLLLLGSRPPIRRMISSALVKLIEKGDGISVYSRVSSLQGWLSDKADKRLAPSCYQGVAQCLGALTKSFGQKLSSSLAETASIVSKLMKYSEVSVRQAGMKLLQNAVEGTQGLGSANAYAEVVRVITRLGSTDRSPAVRATAAGSLRVLANVGGPGLVGPGIDLCAALCIKAMEDPAQSVRDEFAAALGALLALGLHPNKQVQPRGKGPVVAPKAMEGAVQKYLVAPFTRAAGTKARDLRMGIAMAWVAFLQALRLNYGMSDLDLPAYGMQALSMLAPNAKAVVDGHAQACVLYVLRVGVVEQMSESAERELSSLLVKELSVADNSTSMLIVTLRVLTHLLKTLGEVTAEAKVAFDESLTKVLSHPSEMVRVEAALTVRALAVADPTSVHGLMSCGLTALRALRDSATVEKGDKLKSDLDSLHGQAAMLSALLTAAPRLPLGVPSRLPTAILDVARQMVLQPDTKKAQATAVEKEAGWMLVGALVSSMAKEELKEHQFDLLALWAVPFGGNCMERLKRTSTDLQSELTCWSMAMEALTAFIKSHVVPSLSPDLESVLLNPVLGYLSGALVYVSSPTLQEAPASLRPAVELLTIRTLDAFRSLPDPVLYKNDHHSLLALCMSPFSDASTVPGSTCLRELLDVRDASLGPWVPGRDSLEDELRAFEGGSDALLPCIWEHDTPFFPQALPQLISLVNSMLLCFGIVFAAQTEKNKLHLLDLMLNCMKQGRKQSWRNANATNVCVSLLGGLKACVTLKASSEPEVELWKRVQELVQSVLFVDGTSLAHRRAAAEILGLLARLGGDAFAPRLARSLLNEAASSTDASQKCAIALSLGCVHRSVGGMALSALVPAVIQGLCNLAKDATDGLYIWALHGLWLTADAAGLSFMPHVEATLSLCIEMLLSEEHSTPQLWQCVGRVVNAMIAVLGPELVPGSPVFSRCKSIVAEISTAVEPAAQLECVLYAQQLVLFAPQAVPAHDIVQTLRATLTSRQPSLRQAAVATLRHMSERDPMGVVPERVEEDLLAMLDNETDLRIIRNVCLTLERLQEVACPTCPSRWLRLCRNVVLAASSTRTAAGDAFHMSSGPSSPTTASAAGPSWQAADANDNGEDDDEDSVVSIGDRGGRVSGGGAGASGGMNKLAEGKLADADQLPRYRTRVFAAECLNRLPLVVGSNPAHFDLQKAREERQIAASKGEPAGDWLVCLLGELVALAYQVATGTMENVRPLGIGLLRTLLQKFGSSEDPDYEGHLLLEQYQLITCGLTGGDRGVIQRVMALLSLPLSKWDDLSHPSFAEWVGCRVKVGILAAHAAIKSYTVAGSKNKTASPTDLLQAWGSMHSAEDPVILKPLLCKQLRLLSQFWIGLLRDYAVARSQIPAVQAAYKPFLQASKSPAVMAAVRTFLDEAWAAILEAVTSDSIPASKYGWISNGDLIVPLGAEPVAELGLKAASGEEGVKRTRTEGDNADMGGGIPGEKRASTVGFLKSIASANGFTVAHGKRVSHTEEGCIVLEADDFIVVWALALMVLCQGGSSLDSVQAMNTSSRPAMGMGWMMYIGGSSGPAIGTGLGLSPRLDVVGSQLASLGALKHLTGKEFCLTDFFSTELCRELLQVLIDIDVEKTPQVQLAIAELFEKLMTGLPEEYLADETVMNSGAELGVSYMHRLIALEVVMTRGEAPEIERALSCVMSALTKYAARITPQVPRRRSWSYGAADIWSEQRGRMLAGVVESLALTTEKILGKNDGELVVVETEGDTELVHRLPVVLTIMSHFTQCLLSKKLEVAPSLRDSSRSRFITSMHNVLTSHYHQMPLTSSAAASIGEALKLFVLLHSLLDDPAGQLQVLYVLLPTIIVAAGPHLNGSAGPASAGLTTMAVKLITHFASIPTSASQFKDVLASLPECSRQQLQAAVRASMGSSTDSYSPMGTPHSNPWGLGSGVPTTPHRLAVGLGGGFAALQQPFTGAAFSNQVGFGSTGGASNIGMQLQAEINSQFSPAVDDEEWGDFDEAPVRSQGVGVETLDWTQPVSLQQGAVVYSSAVIGTNAIGKDVGSGGWGEFGGGNVGQRNDSVLMSATTADDSEEEWGNFSSSAPSPSFETAVDRNASQSVVFDDSHRKGIASYRASRTVTFEDDDEDAWGDFKTVKSPSYAPSHDATSYITSDSQPHSAAFSDGPMSISIPPSIDHGNISDDEWAEFQEAVSTTSSAAVSPVKLPSEEGADAPECSRASAEAKAVTGSEEGSWVSAEAEAKGITGSEEPCCTPVTSPSSAASSKTGASTSLLASPRSQGTAAAAPSNAGPDKGSMDETAAPATAVNVSSALGDDGDGVGTASSSVSASTCEEGVVSSSSTCKEGVVSSAQAAEHNGLEESAATAAADRDDDAQGVLEGEDDRTGAAPAPRPAYMSSGDISPRSEENISCEECTASPVDHDARSETVAEKRNLQQDEEIVAGTVHADDTVAIFTEQQTVTQSEVSKERKDSIGEPQEEEPGQNKEDQDEPEEEECRKITDEKGEPKEAEFGKEEEEHGEPKEEELGKKKEEPKDEESGENKEGQGEPKEATGEKTGHSASTTMVGGRAEVAAIREDGNEVGDSE
ncbi:hypothetical protein CBR_g31193 [Chara braunii]|uniref:Uncharacterized protein n=1 Tax=Chara braunii TaxID=69332 RepID=A0A388JXP2_CHABU|nr:hypothetical protein CBR_g31193 [Chara braunii]|eukprot:GBG62555.1 hypothetical protein CBR_g31193 [Chara braunii]